MIWLYSLLPFIIIGLGLFVAFVIVGAVVFHQTMNRHKKCEKYDIKELFEDGEELSKQLFSYENYSYKLVTTHNKKIIAKYFIAKNPNGKLVILSHGIYSNMYQHAPQALEYLKHGFDVFMYNQRSIGGSGGHFNTYGYIERHDLHDIALYIRNNLSSKPIIVHGFSMGGATAAMQSSLNEIGGAVDAYIIECAYSSLREELLYIAKRGRIGSKKQRKLPFKLMINIGNIFTKVFARFYYKDVMPKDSVKSCQKPMLIIHPMGDMTCPSYMGEELYDCKILGVRDIWTPEGSAHIKAYFDFPHKYFDKIENFINANISKD